MTVSSTRQLADPQTLARISKMELRARAVVDGVISGMHKSAHRGSSVEFAQHRDYVQGDEIRHIDWKVYSRSDRFHVKQYEEETNLKATLVLDTAQYELPRSAIAALQARLCLRYSGGRRHAAAAPTRRCGIGSVR